MKKYFLAFGIILVFVGVIVASASSLTKEKDPQYEIIAENGGDWEIEGNFVKDDNLVLSYTHPNLELWPDILVKVEIWPAEHYDNRTVFQIGYNKTLGYDTTTIKVVSKGGGLTVEDVEGIVQEIGGTVTYSGYYWANFTTRPTAYWEKASPTLEVKIVEKEYPFLFVLPIGIGLIAVGTSTSIWGMKASKRKLHYEREKH